MDNISMNDIIESLIKERMKRELDNMRDEAKDDYNELQKVLQAEEESHIDTKQEEFNKQLKNEEKKTWSKLSKEVKDQLIHDYALSHDLNADDIVQQFHKHKIKVKDITYDRINEQITNININ